MDNVFMERRWRSLKYEDVYLKGYADGWEARAGVAEWMTFYNNLRPHQGLERRTPMAVWRTGVDEVSGTLAGPSFGIHLSRLGHAVADAMLVEDVGRVGRVVAELLAELLHACP